MYLHSKHVHPSVLAVMEGRDRKPAPVRKPVVRGLVSESLVMEGADRRGNKVIVEVQQLDRSEHLVVELSATHAYVLNEHGNYDLMRIDEGIGEMISAAAKWVRGAWGKIKSRLAKIFTKPGEVEQLEKLYRKDPAAARKKFIAQVSAQGRTPKQAERMFKDLQRSIEKKDMTEKGISRRDVKMLHAAVAAANAKTPEEMAAAQKQLDQAHELAMAKARAKGTVVAGGGSSEAPVQQDSQQQQAPAEQPQQQQQQPAAPVTDNGFTEGDEVYMINGKNGKPIVGKLVKTDPQTLANGANSPVKIGPLMVDVNGQQEPLSPAWQKGKPPATQPAPKTKPATKPAPKTKPAAQQPPANPPANPPAQQPVPVKATVSYIDANSGQMATADIDTDQNQMAAMMQSIKNKQPITVNGQQVNAVSVVAKNGTSTVTANQQRPAAQQQQTQQPAAQQQTVKPVPQANQGTP